MAAGREEKVVAFVLYPGVTALDLVGPLQVVSSVELFAPGRLRPVVVAEDRGAVGTDTPLGLVPGATFDEVPRPWALVVPGGGPPTIRALADERLLAYVRAAAENAAVVASVCTGSLILAAAGLLDGRPATTHWSFHRLLDNLGARYVPERWVDDGRIVTSAGISAGLDMALHLVARIAGEELARQVQLFLEYDPAPPFGGIDWSGVDRDALAPMVDGFVRQELAGHPELVARLAG